MRHCVKKTAKLNRKTDHRDLLLRNLATSLVMSGRIRTTAAKARTVQPFVERLLATATKKAVQPREAVRYLKTILLSEAAQKKVLSELTKKYTGRAGGYTRLTPLGLRAGDAAPECQIELI